MQLEHPRRRGALQLSVAAIVAGLTAPVPASAAAPGTELATPCNQLVAIETELWLLPDHDEHAPDFGPNHARDLQLADERDRLTELISECQSWTDAAGIAAMARAAMTWTERNHEGIAICQIFGEEMMLKLAEGASTGFVWPPRPGDCSTARWAPPTLAREIAEHSAAYEAEMAPINAKFQAEQEAEKAERARLETPSLLTDDELRRQVEISRKSMATADQIRGELADEMARRGLVAA
jgi:hypothetical protein